MNLLKLEIISQVWGLTPLFFVQCQTALPILKILFTMGSQYMLVSRFVYLTAPVRYTSRIRTDGLAIDGTLKHLEAP